MKRRIASVFLAVAMLLSLCTPVAFAADSYNASVKLQNKADGGIEVVVTTDSQPVDPYKVYFFKSTHADYGDAGISGPGDLLVGQGSQDDFQNNSFGPYGTGISYEITVTGTEGKATVTGLDPDDSYWVIAWGTNLGEGTSSTFTLDASGNLVEPYAATLSVGDFDDLSYTGSDTPEVAVTVTNTGSAALTNAVVTLTEGGADFSIEGTPAASIDPAGVDTGVKLKLNTKAVGTYSAKLALTADNGVTAEATVSATIGNAKIASVTVTGVTEPSVGGTDSSNPTCADTGVASVSAVTWNPAVTGNFLASTEYKAQVTLTAAANYEFAGTPYVSMTGAASTAIVGTPTATSLTIEGTFAVTGAKVVNSIAVTGQPTKLSYKSSEALDLSGLEVELTYNDGTTETVAFADFGSKGITASPAHGAALTVATDEGNPVTVSANGKSDDTSNLTVAKMTATIQNPGAITTGVYAGVAYTLPALNSIVIKDANGTVVTDKYENVRYDHASVIGTTLTHNTNESIVIGIKADLIAANSAEYEVVADGSLSVTVQTAGTNDLAVTSSATLNLEYGDTSAITTSGGNGNTITYTSSNTNKVTVDGSGVITVKDSTGSVTISLSQAAKLDGGAPIGSVTLTDAITVNLSPRVVDISGTIAAENRVYDGGNTATITTVPSGLTVSNKVSGDNDITLTGTFTGTFQDNNGAVETGKSIDLVTTGVAVSGTNSSHYTLTGTTWPAVTANITARPVTVSLKAGVTKVYGSTLTLADSNFDAQATDTDAGLVGGHTIANLGITGYTCGAQAATADVNGYAVTTVTAANTNYAVSVVGTNEVAVTPATLTIALPTVTKVYDGGTTITTVLNASMLSGVQNSDTLTVAWASGAQYASSNAGNAIALNQTGGYLALGGAKAGNYTLTQPVTPTGTIEKKEVAFSVGTKSFTTTINVPVDVASGNAIAVTGGIGGNLTVATDYTLGYTKTADTASSTLTGSVLTPTAKGAATVQVAAALTAAGQKNYTFAGATTAASENIAVTASDKATGDNSKITYNAPTLTYSGLDRKADFNSAFGLAGSEGAVTKTELVFKNSSNATITDVKDADSYKVEVILETSTKIYTKEYSFAIGKADLATGWDTTTINSITATKTYDGNGDSAALTAGGSYELTGENSEKFTLTLNTSTVDYETAGNYDAATDAYSFKLGMGDFTIAPAAESNYNLPNKDLTFTNKGSITQAAQGALSINALPATITYGDSAITLDATGGNGTGDVTFTVSAGGDVVSITNDQLAILKSGSFTVQAMKAGDTNYTAGTPITLSGTVAKKELTITPDSLSGKASNGVTGIDLSTALTISEDLTGLKSLTEAAATLSYGVTDTDAGAAMDGNLVKWNTAGAATVNVTMVANDYYTLAVTAIPLTVTNKASQTIKFSPEVPATKTYGDDPFTVTAVQNSGTGSGTITYDIAAGKDSVASISGNTITILKAGSFTVKATKAEDADNTEATVTATVTVSPKEISIVTGTLAVDAKPYDGMNTATTTGALALSGMVGGDVVTLTGGTIVFGSVNKGTDITMTLSGYTLDGADKDKYTLSATMPTITGTINAKPITLNAGTVSKVYDGTADKGTATTTVALGSDDAAAGETITFTGFTGGFNSKDVASANDFIVDTATWTVSGTNTDAANYVLSSTEADRTVTGEITPAALTVTSKAPVSMNTGSALTLKQLINVTGIQIGDTIDGLFGAMGSLGAANIKGVTVDISTNATPPVQATLPLAAGSYTFDVTITKGTFETANGNYTITNPAIADAPLTVTKPSDPPPSGGGGSSVTQKVTFKSGANGKLVDDNGKEATSLSVILDSAKYPTFVPKAVAADGYRFQGWSTDGGKTFIDPAAVKVTSNSMTYTAVFAKIEHASYIVGVGEGLFAPTGNLTRAAAIAMLSRLTPGFDENKDYGMPSYPDVSADDWASNYIAFCEQQGIAKGCEDGTFQGDRFITRGEFAAMVARFVGMEESDTAPVFADSVSHWASGYIAAMQEAGIIGGYLDGTYRPDTNISRSEAVKIVNYALGRTPSTDKTLDGYTNLFSDIDPEKWFYYDVMEASQDHVISDFHSEK